MRWEAFLAVGGLDPQFGLGPYGDADLAMSMRQRGYQVCERCRPLQTCVHRFGWLRVVHMFPGLPGVRLQRDHRARLRRGDPQTARPETETEAHLVCWLVGR